MVWTQSVTRTCWLAVKLALIGFSSVVVAGLMSLLVTWWSSPIDRVKLNRLDAVWFGVRGITPIGYALFALALGVTVGVLDPLDSAGHGQHACRLHSRSGGGDPVGATTFPPPPTPAWLSHHLRGIGVVKGASGTTLSASAGIPNDWVYSAQIVDKAGHALTSRAVQNAIPSLGAVGGPHAQGVGPDFQTQFQAGGNSPPAITCSSPINPAVVIGPSKGSRWQSFCPGPAPGRSLLLVGTARPHLEGWQEWGDLGEHGTLVPSQETREVPAGR